MIVWCQKCETTPIELDVDSGVYWLGDPEDRPWCRLCTWAMDMAIGIANESMAALTDPSWSVDSQSYGNLVALWEYFFPPKSEDHIIRSVN